MDDTTGAALVRLIFTSVALNLAVGAYLLCRFIMAQRLGGSTRHWSAVWGVGWLFLLAGLPLFLFGGIYLIFVSTVLWVIAVVLCRREPIHQVPPLDPTYGCGTDELYPPAEN